MKCTSPNPNGGIRIGLARVTRDARGGFVARYFLFPIDFLGPTSIWPYPLGKVWFAIFNPNAHDTSYALGCLDVTQNAVTGYHFNGERRPSCFGLIGDVNSERLWLTEDERTGQMINTGVYQYTPGESFAAMYKDPELIAPREITLDKTLRPWFTSHDGYVNTVAGEPTGRVSVDIGKFECITGSVELKGEDGPLREVWHSDAPPILEHPSAVQAGPFKRWAVNGPASASPSTPLVYHDEVYFAETQLDSVGKLAI